MSTYIQRTSYLVPQAAAAARTDDAHWAHAFARIENHFFVHGESLLHILEHTSKPYRMASHQLNVRLQWVVQLHGQNLH
jgi:predicted secreted Zn-dependent protease